MELEHSAPVFNTAPIMKIIPMKIIPIKNILDSISPTFCAAKWNLSTIWLNNGTTASCYHCEKHKIDKELIRDNPSALHNTINKKKNRKLMLIGAKPDECQYCWDIEESSPDSVSDRFLLSDGYSLEELNKCVESGYKLDHSPDKIEIAFDNLCNFSCMYCNPIFSSTWQRDIKINGVYQNLNGSEYHLDGDDAVPFTHKNENNPFIHAFFDWLAGDLKFSLKELRLTGGEPLMSPHFNRIITELKKEEYSKIHLSINSNLGCEKLQLQQLIDLSHHHNRLSIFTSNESTENVSEFIRSGINWSKWKSNVEYLLDNLCVNNESKYGIAVNVTINALSLFDLVEFLEEIKYLKKRKTNKVNISIFISTLVTPHFQSVKILPRDLILENTKKIREWLKISDGVLTEKELSGLTRHINLFESENYVGEDTQKIKMLRNQFKCFVFEYARRRNKSFSESFNKYPDLIEWIHSITMEKSL